MAGYLASDVLGDLQLGNANVTPTTLRAVANALADRIRQVTPTFPLFRDHPWTAVPRVLDVPGQRLRLYCCEWDPPEPVYDGLWGDDALQHKANLRVFVNYRGLPELDDDLQDVHAEMPTADANDLLIALLDGQDPVVPGLIDVLKVTWTWEEAEPGHAWGAHHFEVHFMLAH